MTKTDEMQFTLSFMLTLISFGILNLFKSFKRHVFERNLQNTFTVCVCVTITYFHFLTLCFSLSLIYPNFTEKVSSAEFQII